MTNGTCFVKCEETVVMVNATMSKEPRDGVDFFPLNVDYEEKMYSVGKFQVALKRERDAQATKVFLFAV